MATKTIKFIPKITQAKTQYREIDLEDMTWLKMELVQALAIMAELDQYRDEDSRWVREQWWHKRTNTLPRGQQGENTPASFVGGLLKNIMFGDQRDLTDKQMEAVQNITHVLGSAFPECTQVRFQIGF